jgi:hypothetical protein
MARIGGTCLVAGEKVGSGGVKKSCKGRDLGKVLIRNQQLKGGFSFNSMSIPFECHLVSGKIPGVGNNHVLMPRYRDF